MFFIGWLPDFIEFDCHVIGFHCDSIQSDCHFMHVQRFSDVAAVSVGLDYHCKPFNVDHCCIDVHSMPLSFHRFSTPSHPCIDLHSNFIDVHRCFSDFQSHLIHSQDNCMDSVAIPLNFTAISLVSIAISLIVVPM